MSVFQDIYKSVEKDFIRAIVFSLEYCIDIPLCSFALYFAKKDTEYYNILRTRLLNKKSEELELIEGVILKELSKKYLFCQKLMNLLRKRYERFATDPEYYTEEPWIRIEILNYINAIILHDALKEFALILNTAIQIRRARPKPIREYIIDRYIPKFFETCVNILTDFWWFIIPFRPYYDLANEYINEDIRILRDIEIAWAKEDGFKKEFLKKTEEYLKIVSKRSLNSVELCEKYVDALGKGDYKAAYTIRNEWEVAKEALLSTLQDVTESLLSELLFEVAIRLSGPVRRYFLER